MQVKFFIFLLCFALFLLVQSYVKFFTYVSKIFIFLLCFAFVFVGTKVKQIF